MDLCNVRELRGLLGRHGFSFSKSMGQNFLVASWVPERIVTESRIDRSFGVLEIGPGVGCLTVPLSGAAGKVVSVELDRTLIPVLEEVLSPCDNTEVIQGDILKLDLPRILNGKLSGLRPAVCANLPYHITTPILSKLISVGCFEQITVMVQREVARRMCARAGTPDYGAFTVYINYHTEPEILFDVPPDCFHPRPKVVSSVIILRKRKTPPAQVTDEALFFRVVRAAFAQRRKTLLNCLSAAFGSQFSREELTRLLSSCGFDSRIRGETLDIDGFAQLANQIRRMGSEETRNENST